MWVPRTGRPKKPFPKDKAKALLDAGLTVREIAKEMGVSYVTAVYRLKELGLRAERRATFRDIPWDEAIALYTMQGWSAAGLARKYGCSVSVIKNGLRKLGVRIRNSTEQVSLDCALGRGHDYVNEEFFDTWTPEMAYVLGWIVADGNIPNTLACFRITSCDIDHLRNLGSLFAINPRVEIKAGKGNWRDAGTLVVNRRRMVKRLLEFGVGPNKSKTLTMPLVPDDCFRHFLRGVFEGDGCFTVKKGRCPVLTIVSGSDQFLRGLNDRLVSLGVEGGILTPYNTKAACSRLDWYRKGDIERLFHIMYDGVPPVMRLERKYRKMAEYFGLTEVLVS